MDRKYGRIFTTADVELILQRYDPEFGHGDTNLDDLLTDMDQAGTRFKFEADEPVFVLRGHDRRAVGAIKHYQEHQSHRAPTNHLEGIASALQEFLDYRDNNPGKIREPD